MSETGRSVANSIAVPQLDGTDGESLGSIDVAEATRRVKAYCSHAESGWVVYDVAAEALRPSGLFDTVTPWSLNWANLLNGRVSVTDIIRFNKVKREEYCDLLRTVPVATPLAELDEDETKAVAALCAFGFDGVWAATKMSALYRPASVPVLDGHLATALGFARNAFAVNAPKSAQYGRSGKIGSAVFGLQRMLRDSADELAVVRRALVTENPTASFISDLRLLDIILWTSENDRRSQPTTKSRTQDHAPGTGTPALVTIDDVAPIPIGG